MTSSAWKDLERTTARILDGKRIVRSDYGDKNSDVAIEDFPNFKIDTKRYKKFYTFTLYEIVREKYCKSPNDWPILVLRQHNKKTKLAVIDLELLAKLMEYVRTTGGQKIFKQDGK